MLNVKRTITAASLAVMTVLGLSQTPAMADELPPLITVYPKPMIVLDGAPYGVQGMIIDPDTVGVYYEATFTSGCNDNFTSYHVFATPQEGYYIADDATREWDITLDRGVVFDRCKLDNVPEMGDKLIAYLLWKAIGYTGYLGPASTPRTLPDKSEWLRRKPTDTSPSQPTTTKPAQPTTTKPAQPTTTKPAQPTVTKPAQPSVTKPAQPTTANPAQPTTAKPAQPTGPSAGKVLMHRLYNPNSGEHFYTASTFERDSLVKAGWRYENVGWTAPDHSGTPVHRLYNRYAGDHHYTTSIGERDSLVKAGWNYEGIGWYSDDNKTTPLYRQYNPNATTGSHNYTVSKDENDHLVKAGWKAEGIAWYGV